MTQVVAFDPTYWALRYPEFSTVSLTLVAAYFNEAGIYCDNSGAGPITDITVGGTLYLCLHALTAHICALNSGVSGQAATPLIGRVSDASEGSVSVSVENEYPPGTPQWYQQTKYGAAYWAMTVGYRTAQYIPPACPLPLGPVFARWGF